MHHFSLLLRLFPLLPLTFAACIYDDPANDSEAEGRMVKVRLHICTRSTSQEATRWVDTDAADDEMMNTWEVVVADAGGQVVAVKQGTPAAANREIDTSDDFEVPAGTYTLYSFANVSEANVKTWLGITGVGSTISATADAITVGMTGNLFDPAAADNGFGARGIPMSNKQTVDITQDGSVDAIVVRMLAKLTLSITNEAGEALSVNSVTLSDITANATTGSNIKLFPQMTYHGDMEAHHKDIQPNLADNAATEAVTQSGINMTLADKGKGEVSFYVNESATPANATGLFLLTLSVSKAGGSEEYRFTIISDNDANDWNYIARNDHRTIPLTLDSYRLTVLPYDFPPIGVLPVSVSEVDAANHIYAFTFHDNGHFHLVPQVTHGSTAVPYSATAPATGTAWTLAEGGWSASWTTAADIGGAQTANPGSFYATGTETADTPEGGGVPVFDTTTTWNGTTPFVFGRIATTTDSQVYHELRLRLYVDGQYRRDMLYRFFMKLDIQ